MPHKQLQILWSEEEVHSNSEKGVTGLASSWHEGVTKAEEYRR